MSKVIVSSCIIYILIRNANGQEDVPAGVDPPTKDTIPSIYPLEIKPAIYPGEPLFRAEAITNYKATSAITGTIIRRDASDASPSAGGGNPTSPAAPPPNANQSSSSEKPSTAQPAAGAVTTAKTATHHVSAKQNEDNIEAEVWVAQKFVQWIYDFLESVTKRFPKTTKLVEIGKSKENRPIFAVEIAHKLSSGATIVIDAGYDSTDRSGVNLALYAIYQLVSNIPQNLVSLMGVRYIVVPLINVDGYNHSVDGKDIDECRKNLFASFDVGKEPEEPCPGFFQEQETIAVGQYYQSIQNFKLYFSLDSSGGAIGYPYGMHLGVHNKSREMAENMKHVIDHSLSTNITLLSLYGILKEIHGTPIDWLRDKVGVHYCIYLCIQRAVEDAKQFKLLEVNYEAIRYGILQLQLTDHDIAQAIYDDFERPVGSNVPSLRKHVGLIIVIVVTGRLQ